MSSWIKKGLLALLISISVVGSASVWAYTDVPSDSPYYYAVEFLRRLDILSDKVSELKVDMPITRAEFIRYLVQVNNRKFKADDKPVKLPFKDTRNNAWYASYFDEAIRLGILDENEKKVRPFENIRKSEALELLFHSKSIPIPKVYQGDVPYRDLKDSPLAPMVMRALQLKITTPQSKTLFGLSQRLKKADAILMVFLMEEVTVAPPELKEQAQPETALNEDFKLQKIITAWKLLLKNYVDKDKLDPTALGDAALHALMKSLDDPYSVYLDEAENASFSDDLGGHVEGIGAMVGFDKDKNLSIIAPIADSPAEKAGLKPGDIIRLVNGTDIKGMALEKAVSLIKGPKGTSVTLSIERAGQPLDVTIVRDAIIIKALSFSIKDGNIMYIHLLQFSQSSPQEFAKVAEAIKANSDIKGIVLDMRDDPGGLLDAALSILNHFLKPESAAVKIKYNAYSYTQYATGPAELGNYPLMVMINKGSASASEIVAGALQDFKIGTVVGTQSFGKGTVQELNYFKDKSSIKMTIAKWLTPLGHSIQGQGITPDIEIPVPEGQTSEDFQLARTLQLLHQRMNAAQ